MTAPVPVPVPVPKFQPKFQAGERIILFRPDNNVLELSKDIIECVCIYEDRFVYHFKSNPEQEVTEEGLFNKDEALSRFSQFLDNE